MRILVALLLSLPLAAPGPARAAGPAPQTEEQKTLYAAGAAMAQSVAAWHLAPEQAAFLVQGFSDAVSGGRLAVDLDEMRPEIQAFARARATAGAAAERKAAEPFLARAAAEKGARKTASGLVFTEIAAGTGATPGPEDRVKVHYHGTLIDGTVFDSSVQRGQPAAFQVKKVIPCWTEGLQLMKVGGKARFVCPDGIAYGDRGAPPRIKPGATLVFEVELLAIEP
jgi:FKBP-type peptidyl-prolyl cis-trans isomerase